jgi:hypothetical protein
MKIAYLVLAHNNYHHLQKLVNALSGPHSRIYIHIDRKSSMPLIERDGVVFIKERLRVYWGCYSEIAATLKLLKRALKDGNDYYLLLSGVDYPIKPNEDIIQKMDEGGEFIEVNKGFPDRYRSRFEYYFLFNFVNRREWGIKNKDAISVFFLVIEKLLRMMNVKRKIPFDIYTGWQWFGLSHNCVNYIVQQAETNKVYKRFFKFSRLPSEAFFQTIIGNSPFYSSVRNCLTYADWTTRPAPAVIKKCHLEALKNSDCLFARKFNDDSTEIIDLIEQELRGTQSRPCKNIGIPA